MITHVEWYACNRARGIIYLRVWTHLLVSEFFENYNQHTDTCTLIDLDRYHLGTYNILENKYKL